MLHRAHEVVEQRPALEQTDAQREGAGAVENARQEVGRERAEEGILAGFGGGLEGELVALEDTSDPLMALRTGDDVRVTAVHCTHTDPEDMERFLAGELPFLSIVDIVRRVLDRHAGHVSPIASVDEALHWDTWARNEARGIDVAAAR